jgi:hypothetical protein
MCFSPEVDALAGLLVGVVAVDAVRHVRRPEERALAVLPALFAVHQLIEAFVWWSLEGRIPTEVGEVAEVLYLVIALVVLPALVPIAVLELEPDRRSWVAPFVVIGVAVSAILLYSLAVGPVAARVEGHHLAYDVEVWNGGLVTGLYVVTTCGALLASAHLHIRWWAVGNLVAVAVLAVVSETGFISLWCVWAAVTSVAIAAHLRYAPRPPRRAVDEQVPVTP